MQELKELVQVVTKNKIRKINVIGNQVTTQAEEDELPLINQLYEGIVQGEFDDDKKAAQALFGKSPTFQRYKKLKSELKNRLINTLFFIDVGDTKYTDYERTLFTCRKELLAARTLWDKGAFKLAVQLFNRVHNQARRIEKLELLIESGRLLRNTYATTFFDKKKYEYFDAQFEEYSRAWLLENLAEKRYGQLVQIYLDKKSGGELLSYKAKEFYLELSEKAGTLDFYRLNNFIYQIRIIGLMAEHNYLKTIEVGKEAIEYHQSKPFISNTRITPLYYQILICYTNLGNYEDGYKASQESLSLQIAGSLNWFKNRELTSILAFYTENYQQAYDIYSDVIAQKSLINMPSILQETWKLIGAFIHYLVYTENIKPELSDKRFTKFRLGRFLNNVPEFSKEKRAMNIPVLVIQILFLVGEKKYNRLIDRIEAIEKYTSRHIHKDENYRSKVFIKMLLQLPKANFHKRAVIRKAEKYVKKLQEVPLEVANQTYGVEIIPYEKLWEFVLNSLKMRSFHLKR